MVVDSYLELFTTLFGWRFYDIIWSALSETGLVFIPFIVIVARTWIEAAKSASFRTTWAISLKTMEIELYTAIFVAIFAGVPAITLQANAMSYSPAGTVLSGPQPTATVGSPQSTYGQAGAFANPPGAGGTDVAQIPVWWFFVLSVSKGVNHAIIAGFPTEMGIQQIQQQAQLTTIPDATLRQEAGQFYNDCYLAARSKYLRDKPSSAAITAILDEYGEDDTEWMGSHVYRSLYYPALRAQRRVEGWAYDPARDVDYDPTGTYTAGQPTCTQWWEDTTQGLRVRVSDDAARSSNLETFLVRGANLFAPLMGGVGLTNSAEKTRDWAVRRALRNSQADSLSNQQPDDLGAQSSRSGFWSHTIGIITDAFGVVGAGTANLAARFSTNVLKPALPMVQALVLMAIYFILPFVVLFSQYSLGMLALGAIGIFTVNFWTVLWKFGAWAQERLAVAMYDDVGALFSHGVLDVVHSTSKVIVFDTMLMMFMLGLPLLWTAMMAWVGIRAFDTMSRVLGEGSGAAATSGAKASGSGMKAGNQAWKKLQK